ncbi:hypothetical protein [Treponema sp.]|uniref:hypothetical protein n=1 Tax=Treponema sp. TaxID=166 RepID=UPI003F0CA1A9
MKIAVFTGGEAPSPDDAFLFFSRNRPDYVIAADSGLDTADLYVRSLGEDFAPDMILGDMDSLRNSSLLEKYSGASRSVFPCDKDFTDTELALFEARKVCGTAEVILVGGNGGCVDHFISIYDSFSEEFHADVWLCINQVAYFVPEKKRARVFDLMMEDRISVARLTSSFCNSSMEAEGLEWNCFRQKGMASISNRISRRNFTEKKPAELFAEKGSFLIFAPYHCRVELE